MGGRKGRPRAQFLRHLTQPELDLFRILGSFSFFVTSHLHYFLDYSNEFNCLFCHNHLTISYDQTRGTEYAISGIENSLGSTGVLSTSQPGVAFFSVTLRIFTAIFLSRHMILNDCTSPRGIYNLLSSPR